MTTLTPDPFSSLTTKYIWDGWNIAAEIIIDEVTPTTNITYYTWGLDLSGTLQGAGGVGGLLAATVSTPSTNSTYLTLSDANGNITEYVDHTGTTVAHGEHSAFGETELSGSMKDEFIHWFSSKPLDTETGLVQYQLRPYSPALGIFMPRDPAGEDGGIKLTGILDNDCVDFFDHLGLAKLNVFYRSAAKKKYIKTENWASIEEDILFTLNENIKGGLFKAFKFKVNRSRILRICSVDLYMEYEVQTLQKSYPVNVTEIFYNAHFDITPGGGIYTKNAEMMPLCHGVAVKHELGHGKAWWDSVKPEIEKMLAPLKWWTNDHAVKNIINRQCNVLSVNSKIMWSKIHPFHI